MGWHITTDPDWVGCWVAEQVGGDCDPLRSAAIGLSPDGLSLCAGVLYEDWNGRSLVVHIAITGRMTPAYLAAIFDYPFNVCGAEKIIAPIPSSNTRSIRLVTNMGFHEEGRIADAAPTGDICLYTLAKTDCRFLRERYGKKQTSTPSHS